MNVERERVRKVADLIEADHDKFTMRCVYHWCGTPGCIAGYTRRLMELDSSYGDTLLSAGRFLGFGDPRAGSTLERRLFKPERAKEGYDWLATEGSSAHITWDHAVRCLRNLAETGEVDWRGTKEKQDV